MSERILEVEEEFSDGDEGTAEGGMGISAECVVDNWTLPCS